MDRQTANFTVGGLIIVIVGVNLVILGIDGHHRVVEVIGWAAEIIGVFLIGLALGIRRGKQ